MSYLQFWISIFFILSYFSQSECIATYSIDLSSEFLKVAIVKPGVPMEIALDKESQRKTPSVVYINRNERLFGNAAMNMGIKYPKYLYHSISTLIGKTIDHPIVQQFIKNFPYYDIIMDQNNQLAFRHDENTIYTTEELLAMIMENAKNIAETYSEMTMKGGIIVIPPYFNQEERLAILRAAKIASINVLQLMNSNTAVALNYGIFRRKSFNSSAQYYMFYDVGSSSTIVSIAGYQVVKTKEFGMMVENPQVSIIGLGFDRTLGASQFILRLQSHLAKTFNEVKKPSKDVTTVPRSMAKLYKEASRVLKVLSANNDIYAQVENVHDDQDLKVKITRAEFEEMCKDLFDRFTEPIHKALEAAQLPMPVIKEIILMGGGTRIPKLQEILLRTTEMKELGKSINTDEAAALGAVYQAAHVSPGFKVKTFIVKDANLIPVAVDFMRFKTQENREVAHFTSRTIFDFMNLFPMKRVLTFNKHSKNFNFNVTYGSADIDKKTLFCVEVNNLTDVYTGFMELKDDYVTDFKGVKAHFGLDNSGIITLNYIEALFERQWNNNGKNEASTFEKIGNTISNLFGSSTDEPVDKKEDGATTNNTDAGNNNTQVNKTASNGTDTNKTQSSPQPKIETIHQNLNFISTYKASILPSEDVIETSRKKIVELKSIDDEKASLEKAQNELESYIFLVKSVFEKDIYAACSTEKERTLAVDTAKALGDWYEEQGPDTPKEEYSSRYEELRKLMSDIDYRVKEFVARPEIIGKMNAMLNTSSLFLANLGNLTGENNIFTQAEYDSLKKLIAETTKWFANTNRTLETMKLYENPKITAYDFEPHVRSLEREISYLLNKLTIWKSQPPPPTTSAPNDNKTSKERDKGTTTPVHESRDGKDKQTEKPATKQPHSEPEPQSGMPQTQSESAAPAEKEPKLQQSAKKVDEHVDL